MALNLKALKDVQEDLNNRGNGDLYFFANEIKDETDVRLLPPLPHQNGIYFIEQVGYWINKKYYVSPATFDEDCPIDEEIEEAKALGDPDINELLNSQSIQKKSRFLIPILMLDCKFDKDGECTSYKVVDRKGKILVAGPMLMKAINKVVISRNFQNGTEDGIMDRVKGHNLILNKTGKNLDTDYTAIGWNYPLEIEEAYYKPESIPDIVKITEDDLKSNKFLRGIIRNFLYGEAMPKEGDNAKGKPATAPADDEDFKSVPKPKRNAPEPEEEEEEAPKPKRRAAVAEEEEKAPKAKRVAKPEPEEEEEEETPKPKPKAAAKPKPKPEPEAEEEEEPAVEDTRPKRRNILKDLDDIN